MSMHFPNFALMDSREITNWFADAQQALSFITPNQLRIEAQVYQIRYPSFDYAGLMFVNTNGDMWDAGSIFFSGDIAGQAQFLSARANDMPFADISADQFERANQLAGIGYEWSLGELIRTARFGRNLTADKASAARRVSEQFLFNIAISGSAEKNWTGLINTSAVPSAALGAAWTTATTAQTFLNDINGIILAPGLATRDAYPAEQLLLPPSVIQLMASILIPNTNTTVLEFIRANNAYTAQTGQPLSIRTLYELETAGAGSTRRMMAYNRDPNVVQFHLPGPHTFLEPYKVNSFSWEVAGIMNVGGVEFRIPAGAAYRDNL